MRPSSIRCRERPGSRLRCTRPRPSHPVSGLASLEWLLIISAVGGFAAVLAVAIYGVIDDASEAPSDPAIRLIEADVAAAQIEAEAAALDNEAGLESSNQLLVRLEQRCEELQLTFPDVVQRTVWTAVPAETQRWTCKIQHIPG